MPLSLVPMHALELLRHVVQNLDVESQVRARQNALIACTALAQRRAEWNEVEEFLARSAPANPESMPVDSATRMDARQTAS